MDLGGAYIGHQQTKILKVIEELGLETYDVNTKGKSVLSIGVRLPWQSPRGKSVVTH